jgi:hypothetical protein
MMYRVMFVMVILISLDPSYVAGGLKDTPHFSGVLLVNFTEIDSFGIIAIRRPVPANRYIALYRG